MKTFFYFSITGLAGFLTDYSAFLLLTPVISSHFARPASFLIAVQITYWLNKRLTFREKQGNYWLYITGQSKGLLLNFLCFESALILLETHPYANHIAFISATIPTLFFNFLYARYLTFK